MKSYLFELIGTFILVFFGLGSLHAAILANAHVGLFQIAMIWALGISIAIYLTAAKSGAHLNPAITTAFWLFGGFKSSKVIPYFISQFLGAFLAAALLYAMFSFAISDFEASNNIVRGLKGSELSAMLYAEYFPNPAMAKALNWHTPEYAIWLGALGEFLGTMILAYAIFSLSDKTIRQHLVRYWHPHL